MNSWVCYIRRLTNHASPYRYWSAGIRALIIPCILLFLKRIISKPCSLGNYQKWVVILSEAKNLLKNTRSFVAKNAPLDDSSHLSSGVLKQPTGGRSGKLPIKTNEIGESVNTLPNFSSYFFFLVVPFFFLTTAMLILLFKLKKTLDVHGYYTPIRIKIR